MSRHALSVRVELETDFSEVELAAVEIEDVVEDSVLRLTGRSVPPGLVRSRCRPQPLFCDPAQTGISFGADNEEMAGHLPLRGVPGKVRVNGCELRAHGVGKIPPLAGCRSSAEPGSAFRCPPLPEACNGMRGDRTCLALEKSHISPCSPSSAPPSMNVPRKHDGLSASTEGRKLGPPSSKWCELASDPGAAPDPREGTVPADAVIGYSQEPLRNETGVHQAVL